jgi:hypothetical protein
MSPYSVLRSAETKSAKIEVCDDTIVRVLFKKESEIDARELKNLFDTYNDLTGGKPFAYIYHAEDGTANLDGEAKKFGRLNPNYFQKVCVAVVVKSLAQRIMADFYLKIMYSKTPYKVFNSLEDAEKWCHGMLQKKE